MVTSITTGTSCYTLLLLFVFTDANYVETDKWGQEYCRASYCGIMDSDGWIRCCERYKKCCAYADLAIGRNADPFAYEKEKPLMPKTTTITTINTATTTTEKPKHLKTEEYTDDLGGPIEIDPSPLGSSGRYQIGAPAANLRLSSFDQVKPVTINDHTMPKPEKPRKNDVTYHLPPLHPDIQEMRLEEYRRESCRAKFCGVMGINQWHMCCVRYKNCCAYVDYHAYRANPFYYEPEEVIPEIS